MNVYMNPPDCRFSCKYSPQNRLGAFPAALLDHNKVFSGSRLIEQNPTLSRAAWDFKQLARDQLRQLDVMTFIGRCLTESPQKFGQLLVSPDVKSLSAIIEKAELTRPENTSNIIRSAGVAIELMKMRNRLLFEGPQSAFSYYDSDPNAHALHAALSNEVHSIRIGLHQQGQHGNFVFHPKITALREVLRSRVFSKCLVLCESKHMAEALGILLYHDANVYVSNKVEDVLVRDHVHLVLFSPTDRLQAAIGKFKGKDVILLALRATWEEGAYEHYTELEKSLQVKQGALDFGVLPDRT